MTYKSLFFGVSCFVLLALGAKNAVAVTVKETRKIYHQLIIVNRLPYVPLYIEYNKDLNGWTDGSKVVITSGSLKQYTPGQVAETLGHELAHIKFGDNYHNVGGTIKEDRADFYGTLYATNIGYNRCGIAKKFLLWQKLYGDLGGVGDPHSSNMVRYNNIHKGCKQ